MRRVLVAAALITAALMAPGANAAATRSIELRVGDAVAVAGTKVVCFPYDASLAAIACALWRGAVPVAGTYSTRLAADGTVTLTKVARDGLGAAVFTRKPQARETVYRARPGDRFGWRIGAGVRLECVVAGTGPIGVTCRRTRGAAALAGSYGISISDRAAGVIRFDANGRATSGVVSRAQP